MAQPSALRKIFIVPGLFISLFFWPGFLSALPKIDYRVNFGHFESQGLQIDLEGSGLPHGELTLLVPKLDGAGNNQATFSPFLLHTSPEHAGGLEIDDQELTLNVSESQAFHLSYCFRPANPRNLAGNLFYDGHRCLLQLETMLVAPTLDVQRLVIFESLPVGWKIAGGSLGEEKNSVLWTSPWDRALFLGEVILKETRLAGFDVILGMEENHAEFPPTLQESLAVQLQAFAGFSKRKVPKKLMVVGLKPEKKRRLFPEYCHPWGTGLILVSPEMAALRLPGSELRTFQMELAGALVPWYFPILAECPGSRYRGEIQEYFGWKVLLKTGVLPPEVFLEQMGVGVKTIPSGVSATVNRKGKISAVSAETPVVARISGPTRFFFADLWLEFFGRDNRSLPELFLKSSRPSGSGSVHLEPWFLRLRQERRLARIIEQLLIPDSSVSLADLVRPFGLIYFQRRLPDWGFVLDESLSVTVLKPGLKTGLQVGDRLMAIDQAPISHPLDLIREGSLLQAGKTVTLQVDRQGGGMWLKHPVGSLFYSRFESNKLSDVDKQEKMDRFLAKGKSEF